MTTPEAITRRETWEVKWLWVGILTGPIAWSIELYGSWFLAEVVACQPGIDSGEVAGLPVTVFAAIMNSLLLAATIASGLIALYWYRKLRDTGDSIPEQRTLWMARSGILISITFGLIIAASYMVFLINPGCGS